MTGERAGNHFQLRVPRLAGVDEIAAGFDGIAEAVQRVLDEVVVGKEFVQAGDDAQRWPRVKVLVVGAVKGVHFIEGGDVFQAARGNEFAAGGDVNRAVVAQADAVWAHVFVQGVQNVAAVAGGDVQHVHRFARTLEQGVGKGDGFADVLFALADAAPTDGVQVVAVEGAADGVRALRLVLVDVVEGTAAVVTGIAANAQSFAPARAKTQGRAVERPPQAAQAIARQRRRQFVRFHAAGTRQMCGGDVHRLPGCGKALADEGTDECEGALAFGFAEGVVVETGQDVARFVLAAEAVVEVVLRLMLHDFVVAGDEEQERGGDGLRVGNDARGGVVKAEQDAHRDGADDKRVACEVFLPRFVVSEVACFEVAVHEEVAAQFLQQAQHGAGKRQVEFDAEGGRGEYGAANRRRVVVQPGGDQHRTETLRDDCGVLRCDAVVVRDVRHEILDVGDAGGDTRRIAARAGAVAVTARVPSEKGEVIQAEFVGKIHQAAGVFVAAVKKDDGLVRAAVLRRAVAVEQFAAVGSGEGFFLRIHRDSFCITIHLKPQTRRVAEDSTRLYGEATQHRMRL